MPTELWSYKWHYFSAITALLTGECGYDRVFTELKNAFDGDHALAKQLLPPTSRFADGEAPLIQLIRSQVDTYMADRQDLYDASWGGVPWKLDVLLRRAKAGLPHEILVTPTALIVPWPLKARDQAHKDFLAEVDAYFDEQDHVIPALNDTPGEYVPGRDLQLESVFSVVDVLITEKAIPLPCNDNNQLGGVLPAVQPVTVQARKTALRDADTDADRRAVIASFQENDFPDQFKEWDPASFRLPDTLVVAVHETWRTTETRLVAIPDEEDAHLEFHLGVDVHDTLRNRNRARGARAGGEGAGANGDAPGFIHVRENPHAFGALGPCGDCSKAPLHLRTPADIEDVVPV